MKIIGKDQQQQNEKKFVNLWIDPDDLTNDVISHIKAILTDASLF